MSIKKKQTNAPTSTAPTIPSDLPIALSLPVAVVNFVLKALEDSNLPHKEVKSVMQEIVTQGNKQTEAWVAAQSPKEEIPLTASGEVLQ